MRAPRTLDPAPLDQQKSRRVRQPLVEVAAGNTRPSSAGTGPGSRPAISGEAGKGRSGGGGQETSSRSAAAAPVRARPDSESAEMAAKVERALREGFGQFAPLDAAARRDWGLEKDAAGNENPAKVELGGVRNPRALGSAPLSDPRVRPERSAAEVRGRRDLAPAAACPQGPSAAAGACVKRNPEALGAAVCGPDALGTALQIGDAPCAPALAVPREHGAPHPLLEGHSPAGERLLAAAAFSVSLSLRFVQQCRSSRSLHARSRPLPVNLRLPETSLRWRRARRSHYTLSKVRIACQDI